MIIRKMEPNEIDLIVNLFEYYKDESLISESHWDEQRVVKVIKNYSISWGLFFRVAYDGQRPVGCIGGFITEDPITAERATAIQFNYLKPDYATVDNYSQLIAEFIDWSKEQQAESIKCMDIGNNPDRLSDIYESLGFANQTITVYGKEIA